MGIIDIIKRAFEVSNRNLMLVLVNVLLYICVFVVFVIGAVIFAVFMSGTLSKLPENPQQVEHFMNSLAMSAGVVVIMIAAGFALMVMFWAAYSFVQAGSYGAIIATCRGTAAKFEWKVFWENLKRSGLTVFWLNILWGLIAFGILVVLGIIGMAGFFGVLMPFKDAGNTAAAFGFGVPFFALLILTYLFCMFLLYAGALTSGVKVVDKRMDAVTAMSEALGFIKENFWDVVVLVLLLIAVSFAVGSVFFIVRTIFSIIPILGPLIGVFVIMPIETCINIYIAIFIMSSFTVMLLDRTGELPKPAVPFRPEPVGPALPQPPSVPPAGPTQPLTHPSQEPGPDIEEPRQSRTEGFGTPPPAWGAEHGTGPSRPVPAPPREQEDNHELGGFSFIPHEPDEETGRTPRPPIEPHRPVQQPEPPERPHTPPLQRPPLQRPVEPGQPDGPPAKKPAPHEPPFSWPKPPEKPEGDDGDGD